MAKTFGSVLDAHKGFGPGFDFARVFLAFNVLGWHSVLVAQGTYGQALDGAGWVLNYSVLPMFFGLSGFLVAGSAQRLDIRNFFINRGLRIFPALIVEILLSAVVLGAIYTALPLARYFTSGAFFTYFLNILGFVRLQLPGVFLHNPNAAVVNASIWTVPYELACYGVMGTLIVTGIVRKGWTLVASAALVVGLSMILQFGAARFPHADILQSALTLYEHNGKGPALLPCFILGVAAYTLRHKIPFSGVLALACAITILAMGLLGSPGLYQFTPFTLLTSPILIYLVCFVGLSKIPPLPFFSGGDYSYGVYLYGFPIQQALAASFPGMGWPVLLGISAVVVTLFATLSWRLIEKPILRLRKNFSFVAREREREAVEAAKSDGAALGLAAEPGL